MARLTYLKACELFERYRRRAGWQRPVLPVHGDNFTHTYVDLGSYYAAEPDTGRRNKCHWRNARTGVPEDGYRHVAMSAERSIDIVYHTTPICTIHPDDSITLRTGGWYSINTRKRIESVAGVRISGPLRRGMGDFGRTNCNSHEGGPWLVHSPDGTVCEFFEGMDIDARGRVIDHTI